MMASGVGPLGKGRINARFYAKRRTVRARFADTNNEDDEEIEIENDKTLGENVIEALKYLSSRNGVTKGKKLGYLNALVKVLVKRDTDADLGLRLKEIMLCLRIPLTHESAEVRAATLRVLRYLVNQPSTVADLNELNIHLLISRCIDIELENKVERIQALRLIRKLLIKAPSHFPVSVCRSLIAIAEGGSKENDRLLRICLAVLCELSVLNTDLFITCHGVRALTNSLLDCSIPQMAEAIIGCLLRLYNSPITRSKANVNLGVVVAPFTEFIYVHNWYSHKTNVNVQQQQQTDNTVDDKQMRFNCSQRAILSIIRSWPGLLQLCNVFTPSSPLQAIVDILYLLNDEIRNVLIDFLYETLYIRIPKPTENIIEALNDADPSCFKETWQLKDGFVAAEGLDILPHLSKSRPNLVENHQCVMLSCFLTAKLPDALIKVIVTSETKLSIKATILLGELLHKAFVLLPREVNATSHCLPTLLAEVAASDLERSNRASQAVTALYRLHAIKKRGPLACSLFLREILSASGVFKTGEDFIGDRLHSPTTWSQLLLNKPSSDHDRVHSAIKESKVLSTRTDWTKWQWDQITIVFECSSEQLLKSLDNSMNKHFLRKILDFYKPSSGKFSKVELSQRESKEYGFVGTGFIDFLLKGGENSETLRCLDELLADIHYHFKSVIAAESAHDCLISPTKIASTACRYYFLFIGRLSRSESGRNSLIRHMFLPSLAGLLTMRSDLYLKLIITSLDYSSDWGSRSILERALKDAPEETPRLYATNFLGVLIRSRSPNISQWGINLLIQQLYDASPVISSTALELLDEACDDNMNLEAAICNFASRPAKVEEHLQRELRWRLILIRFLSSKTGFKFLSQMDFLDKEMRLWASEYNEKYVALVEETINDGFTQHQHDEDGTYGRRKFGKAQVVKDIFVPVHLYGQLSVSSEGREILMGKDSTLWSMIETLKHVPKTLSNEGGELLSIKSAIWSLCHVASTPEGAKLVQDYIHHIINIAVSHDLYSLRGTAFYALSLVASNRVGAAALSSAGWCSLHYSRDEHWPVQEDWFSMSQFLRETVAEEEEEDVVEEDDNNDDDDDDDDDDNQKTLTPSNKDSYFSSSVGSGGRSRLSSLFRSLSISGSSNGDSSVIRRLSEGRQSFSKKLRKSLSRQSSLRRNSMTSTSTDPGQHSQEQPPPVKRLSFGSEEEALATSVSPIKSLENIVEEDQQQQKSANDSLEEEAKNSSLTDSTTSTSGISSEDSGRQGATRSQSTLKTPGSTTTASNATSTVTTSTMTTTAATTTTTTSSSSSVFHPVVTRSGQRAYSESEVVSSASTPTTAMLFYTATGSSNLGAESITTSVSSLGSWAEGYYTIRSIHSRRRPPLSESEVVASQERRGVAGDEKTTKEDPNWKNKSKSLDYRLMKLRRAAKDQRSTSMPPWTEQKYKDIQEIEVEPRYWGITLPVDVSLLFPVPTMTTQVDEETTTTSCSSSETPIEIPDKLSSCHGLELHNSLNCLSCFRLTTPKIPLRNSRSRTSSLTHPQSERTIAESSTNSTGGSPSNVRKDVMVEDETKDLLIGDSTDSMISVVSSDVEEVQSNLIAGSTLFISKDNNNTFLGKVLQRKEVLKLIGSMMHFGTKSAEQGLLKMKQKFPNIFNDLCLYSEVSLLLTKYCYRLSSRRFIQELFIDLQYNELYEEPIKILGMEEKQQLTEVASDVNIFTTSNL